MTFITGAGLKYSPHPHFSIKQQETFFQKYLNQYNIVLQRSLNHQVILLNIHYPVIILVW